MSNQPVGLEMATAADLSLAAQRRRAFAAADGLLPPGPSERVAAYRAAEQRLGRIRGDLDPREAAVLMLALLFGLATGGSTVGMPVEDAQVASAVRFYIHGLAPVASPER